MTNPKTVKERQESADAEHSENVPMIVHRAFYTDDQGNQKEKIHGPMPVKEWAAYEKENGL